MRARAAQRCAAGDVPHRRTRHTRAGRPLESADTRRAMPPGAATRPPPRHAGSGRGGTRAARLPTAYRLVRSLAPVRDDAMLAPQHATLRAKPGAGELRRSLSLALPGYGRLREDPQARRPCAPFHAAPPHARGTRPHGVVMSDQERRQQRTDARVHVPPPSLLPMRPFPRGRGQRGRGAAALALASVALYRTVLHHVRRACTARLGGRFLITRGAAVLPTWMLPFEEIRLPVLPRHCRAKLASAALRGRELSR